MSTHMPDYARHVSFQRYTVKVAITLQSHQKMLFWGPRFVGGGIPQILNIHFQTALSSDHVVIWIWLSSVQRTRRLEGEKRKQKKNPSST